MDEFSGGTLLDTLGLIERRFRQVGVPWTTVLVSAEPGQMEVTITDLPLPPSTTLPEMLAEPEAFARRAPAPVDPQTYVGVVLEIAWDRGPVGAGELQFNGKPVFGGDWDAEQLETILRCIPALWQTAHDRLAMYRATDGELMALAHDTLARLTDGGGC